MDRNGHNLLATILGSLSLDHSDLFLMHRSQDFEILVCNQIRSSDLIFYHVDVGYLH